MSRHLSPLRYPGGKGRLSPFVQRIFEDNDLVDGHYVEPYAGGAAVALSLLMLEYASHIHINDISKPLHAFWKSVLRHTEELCRLVMDTPLSVKAWDKQKRILKNASDHDDLALGFAMFFLNRTNRSGILNGGVIGGRDQSGPWKIDARYNAKELIFRIESIAKEQSLGGRKILSMLKREDIRLQCIGESAVRPVRSENVGYNNVGDPRQWKSDMTISVKLNLLLAVVAISGILLAQNTVAANECKRTAGMQVYSNVFVHEETGDLLGYDLAVKREVGSGVDALLYVYEGGESDAGVPLSGQASNNRLSIQGTWVEHLVEHPSKKEIVQTHFVKIVGTLDAAAFRGDLTIEGMEEREQIQLKRVKRIWSCKKWNPSSRK